MPAALREEHARVEAALRELAPLRQRLDALAAPDAELARAWFPAISSVVVRSMDLRMKVERELDASVPPAVRSMFEVKGLLAVMAEFAGRERGGIAGVIAGGRPLTGPQYLVQGENRGNIANSWGRLRIVVQGGDPAVAQAMNAIDAAYFREFEQLRAGVYAASTASEAYPVPAEEWFRQVTAAIDTILAGQTAATRVAEAQVSAALAEAWTSLWIELAAALFVIAMAAFSIWQVGAGVVRPMLAMTGAMKKLAGGDLTTAVPGVGRRDEIGLMADAVQVFKENAFA
jgi:methyl-accepting chemotaxis protein